MKFLNALDESKRLIRYLLVIVSLLSLSNLTTEFFWHRAQDNMTIYIPPKIPSSGLQTTGKVVPSATIYGFAFYVWQSLNHWSNNGMQDYKQQITDYSAYLTPSFKNSLIEDYNNLLNQGELQDRIRVMQGLTGSEYSPTDVKYVGHGTWIVYLKMRLTEMMNSNAKIVKDIQVSYALKVVRYDIDPNSNHWGLAIAGFAKSPVRDKTIV